MALDTQPTFNGKMRGTIWVFLSANRFRVQLCDGQIVDAFVPDHLIEKILPYYSGPPIAERIEVTVELCEPPAMHRIIEIKGGDGFCGEARACRR